MSKAVLTLTVRGEMTQWIQQKEMQSEAKDANHAFYVLLKYADTVNLHSW